ncbi:hypothetical protein F5Y04DRAFT_43452 [Hypomontagnella monticulosa]|nr:hypothetical protein F5Y04DRAFT_43452 [Hypomontagnella monticulosa]
MAMTTTSFRKTTLSHAQKTVLAMSRAQFLEAIRAAARPADKLYVGVCIFRMDAHSSRPSVLLLRRSGSGHGAGGAAEECADADPTTPTTPTSIATSSTATTGTVSSASSRWGRGGREKARQHQHNYSTGSNSGSGGINNGSRTENGDGLSERGFREEPRTSRTAGMWELPGGKVREGDFCISAAVARRVAEQTGLRVVRVLGALQDVRRVVEVRILDWDEDGVGIFANLSNNNSNNTNNTTNNGSNNGRAGSISNLSVLDGATLTSATGSLASSTASSSGASSSTTNRRSPIHNPQLVLRKEYLQLNYAVLVQSYDDLSIRTREHDELVWASFSRAEALRMPEELRTVVHQGLAFAGEYLF